MIWRMTSGLFLGLVLYGLMVSRVPAAERWPANVCAEISAREKITAESYAKVPAYRAHARMPLLYIMRDRCGVDVRAKLAVDEAALLASVQSKPRSNSQSRAPMTCATTSLGGGDSATTCF